MEKLYVLKNFHSGEIFGAVSGDRAEAESWARELGPGVAIVICEEGPDGAKILGVDHGPDHGVDTFRNEVLAGLAEAGIKQGLLVEAIRGGWSPSEAKARFQGASSQEVYGTEAPWFLEGWPSLQVKQQFMGNLEAYRAYSQGLATGQVKVVGNRTVH